MAVQVVHILFLLCSPITIYYCCFNFLHCSPCSAMFSSLLSVSLLGIIFSILCSFFLQFAELSSSILNFHLAYSKPHYELVKTNLNSQARFEDLCSVYPWEHETGIAQVRREQRGKWADGSADSASVPSHTTSEHLAMGRQTETSFWSRAQHAQAMCHWVIHITTAESRNICVTYRLYELLVILWYIF